MGKYKKHRPLRDGGVARHVCSRDIHRSAGKKHILQIFLVSLCLLHKTTSFTSRGGIELQGTMFTGPGTRRVDERGRTHSPSRSSNTTSWRQKTSASVRRRVARRRSRRDSQSSHSSRRGRGDPGGGGGPLSNSTFAEYFGWRGRISTVYWWDVNSGLRPLNEARRASCGP